MEETKYPSSKRIRLLLKLEKFLEGPMIFLGLVWLVLLIIELINGFNPTLEIISTTIWIIFICDFAIKLILAEEKWLFFRKNLLTAVSLIIPALRLFRIFRFIQLLKIFRGTRLIKIVASLNRSMKSLNATMQRRGFAYVMVLSLAVIFAGAAGMHTFEIESGGLASYWDALWWTTMLIITVGTDFWPKSPEGKILTTLLSLYGFAIFGYITASLASFFIGRDAQTKDAPIAGSNDIESLKVEIKELRASIDSLIKSKNNEN